MAMTINPVNDFSINKHNQASTKLGQDNSAARVREKDISGVPFIGRETADSVELSTSAENLASAGSQVADFDQAQGSLAMLQNTIRKQAGLALQTQANISPETAFALLND